jgi:hypothetical protein
MPSPALNAAVTEAINRLDLPLLVISSRVNRGRSGARNRLAKPRARRGCCSWMRTWRWAQTS